MPIKSIRGPRNPVVVAMRKRSQKAGYHLDKKKESKRKARAQKGDME